VLFLVGNKKVGGASDLAGQVLANMRAFTGDSGTGVPGGGGATFKYKAVTMTLSFSRTRPVVVVVEFKRG
jgi:hypothetical protein